MKKMMFLMVVGMIVSCLLACGDLVNTMDDKAMEAYKNGDFEEFLSAIDEEKFIEEGDFDAMAILSHAHYKVGDHEMALDLVTRAYEIEDTIKLRILHYDILTALAMADERATLMSETLDLYMDVFDDLEVDDQVQITYWWILKGDNQVAIDKYEAMLAEGTYGLYEESIYNNLSWACINISDYEKAKKYSQMSLDIEPDDSITLTNLANSHMGLDEYEEARDAYERAVENDAYNSYAVYGLACVMDTMHDENAYIQWQRYTDLRPLDEDGWYGLYNHYLDQEDHGGAIRCLETLVELVPESLYVHKTLLKAYLEGGYQDEYAEGIAKVKEVASGYEVDLMVAEMTYELISRDEGYGLFVDLLAHDEVSQWDILSFLQTLYEKGAEDFDQYLEAVERAKGLSYKLDLTLEFYLESGEVADVVRVAQAIIKVAPDHAYARETLADTYTYAGEYALALDQYLRVQDLREGDVYLTYSIADCLIYLGRFHEAGVMLDALVLEDDSLMMAYVHKARIAAYEGQEDQAVAYLLKAFESEDYLTYVLNRFEAFEDIKKLEIMEKYM